MTEAVGIPNEYGCCLSLRIIPGDGKCRSYRSSGSVSCHGCDAWAQILALPEVGIVDVAPEIKLLQEVIVADYKKCSVADCKSVVHARGMCWKHEREVLGVDPKTGKKLEVKKVTVKSGAEKVIEHVEKAAAVQVKEIIGCDVCGLIPCACFENLCDVVDFGPVEETLPSTVTSRDCSPFEKIGFDIGQLVTEKNAAYGNSFAVSGEFLRLLYPNGITPDQYQDALGLVRVFDKQMRIATDQDAFGESPWRDIAGYGILGVARKLGDL